MKKLVHRCSGFFLPRTGRPAPSRTDKNIWSAGAHRELGDLTFVESLIAIRDILMNLSDPYLYITEIINFKTRTRMNGDHQMIDGYSTENHRTSLQAIHKNQDLSAVPKRL